MKRRNFTFVMSVFLFLFTTIQGFSQTTYNVGTYAELTTAITSSADNDIINFTNNIVTTAQILVTKALVFNGNNFTITVPITGLNDAGVFNASPSAFMVFYISASGKTIYIHDLTIKGGGKTGVYVVTSTTTVKFYNVTISNCYLPTSAGGGLYNNGIVFF